MIYATQTVKAWWG